MVLKVLLIRTHKHEKKKQILAHSDEWDESATQVRNFLDPSGEFWTIDWNILNRITKGGEESKRNAIVDDKDKEQNYLQLISSTRKTKQKYQKLFGYRGPTAVWVAFANFIFLFVSKIAAYFCRKRWYCCQDENRKECTKVIDSIWFFFEIWR